MEGKGDLLLLDRSVYKKVSYSNEWALYCNLEIEMIASACFVLQYDIIYGLDSNSKVVQFKFNPDMPLQKYTRL